jgi:[citrate (pro-3S)-lyase] ligase
MDTVSNTRGEIMIESLRVLNLNSEEQIKKLKGFLNTFDLTLDAIDYAIVAEAGQTIIGSCCKLKNILKCFAIDPNHQGIGLTQKLLTEVAYKAFEQGYYHTFIFSKPANAEIFLSLGYKEIMTTDEVILMEKGSSTISDYISGLNKKYDLQSTVNGAIVMNCNPFTLGHQYLIETAAKQVDRLIIFAVEEDASTFPFKDRFELMIAGTSHLDNVLVLPSSFYIISQATFPNYFLRDREHAFSTYARLDLSIFGHWFSKLNIKIRFVGEEPLDPMTDMYNQTMMEVLPQFGLELKIIARKENDSGVISASKVRALLKQDRWDEVAKFVPKTTYDYLLKADAIIANLKKHDKQH